MSSPYAILGNRPLDQWKVTALREELKKRKLTTKGLKEDLIKRLDEAVRTEQKTAKESTENNLDEDNKSDLPSEQAITGSVVSERAKDPVDTGSDITGTLDGNHEIEIDGGGGLTGEGKTMETDVGEKINSVGLGVEQVSQFTAMESTIMGETIEPVTALSVLQTHSHVTEGDVFSAGGINTDGVEADEDHVMPELSDPNVQLPHLEERSTIVFPPGGFSLLDSEIQSEAVDSMAHLENDDSKYPQLDLHVQSLKCQVSGIDHLDLESQVLSDSISTEPIPIIENNEIKVDVISDNAKLELNVDCEMPAHTMNAEEPTDKKISSEETHASITENVDNLRNVDGDDLGPEKLSLDRSSGDDSMEEDVLESKDMEYKSDSIQTRDSVEKIISLNSEEDRIVDVVGGDEPVEANLAGTENKIGPVPISVKRKYNGNDKEAVGDNNTSKKPYRWNVDGLKSSEPQSGAFETLRTPKDSSQDSQISIRRFKRSDSMMDEVPKDRIVPPSSKPPSNSLRIDRFVRPFTLKAVQELLGKTGAITSFWMDTIKTHCYVSYSSIEEAVETRNAVYNLQWPPNGERMLVAEFVEPEEVKTRADLPPAPPMTSPTGVDPNITTAQPTTQPQPSPRQFPRKPPPQSLPPPPLLTDIPQVRERPYPTRDPLQREQLLPARDRSNLPPPPPLPEKVDPPIVTLDDLFRKTNAIPRIYFLPLSDDQVATKLMGQGKNV